MENNSEALLLRIFIGSTDKINQELLSESIVFKAKEAGLSGATAFKGMLGYGGSSVIRSYKFWEVSDKLPVVIEIIDDEKKVLDFFETIRPMLESMRYGCLVVREKVDVLLIKSGHRKK